MDRQALAGDHRLVDLALAFLHDTVDGHLRSRSHEQKIAHLDLGRRNLYRLAVAEHDRLRGSKVEQFANGIVGTAPGPHLEPVA